VLCDQVPSEICLFLGFCPGEYIPQRLYPQKFRASENVASRRTGAFSCWGKKMDQMRVDKFIAVLDEALKRFERLGRHDRSGDKKTLEEQYLLAKRIYEFILKADGTPDKDLFDEIVQKADFDLTGWLVGLPLSLNGRGGLIDEAVEVGSLFAEIHSPDNFLGDMGIILAEAGRREEALQRIAEN